MHSERKSPEGLLRKFFLARIGFRQDRTPKAASDASMRPGAVLFFKSSDHPTLTSFLSLRTEPGLFRPFPTEGEPAMSKKKSSLLVKIILGILIVLVVLVIAGLLFIDNIAKTAVVNGVPLVLGNDISASVKRLHIEPLNGRMEINDMIIGNPEGYSEDGYAFKLGEVIADADLGSVTKDKIHIEHLRLKDINVVYERGLTSSNLDEILGRLEKKEKEEKEAEQKEDKEESQEKTFQFDKIEIENVGVTLKIKGLPGKAPIAVSIDPLENLGADEKGITALDLTYKILGAIIKKAVALDAVTDALSSVGDTVTAIGTVAAGTATNAASAAVDAGKNAATNVANAATSAAADAANAATSAAVDAASGAVNAASDAFRGIFGGNNNATEEDVQPQAQPQVQPQPQTQPQGN